MAILSLAVREARNLSRQEGLREGGGGTFLGVLADASTSRLWACQIYATLPGSAPRSALRGNAGKPVDIWMDKPVKGPDGMRAANGKMFLTENGADKIDMVTVSGGDASITVLQPLARCNAFQEDLRSCKLLAKFVLE